MKKSIFAAVTAVMIAVSASAFAQNGDTDVTKRQKPTAEQMAQRRTERMTKELNLTDEQAKQVYKFNYDMITEHARRRDAKQADMETAHQKADARLQKILTPEQYAAWQAKVGKQRECYGKAQGQHGGWKGRGECRKGRHGAGKNCSDSAGCGKSRDCDKSGKMRHEGRR